MYNKHTSKVINLGYVNNQLSDLESACKSDKPCNYHPHVSPNGQRAGNRIAIPIRSLFHRRGHF